MADDSLRVVRLFQILHILLRQLDVHRACAPSMGPLLGGILTQLFNWRATFWFLAIFGGVSLASFVLFKDTFRRERSLTYQAALIRMQTTKRKKSTADNTPVLSRTATLDVSKYQDQKVDKSEQEVISSEKKDVESQTITRSAVAETTGPQNIQDITLSLREVNPIAPLLFILRRKNNLTILSASGAYLDRSISF